MEVGDFVYLHVDHSAIGSKLEYKYTGPYVVHAITSPHIVTLRDQATGTLKPNIHLNRLKAAHVRTNDPRYSSINPELFPPLASRKVLKTPDVTNDAPMTVSIAEDKPNSNNNSQLRRSDRLRRKPNMPFFDVSTSSDSDTPKIKKILGQKEMSGITHYLVHMKGEPSENAVWLPFSRLNAVAKAHVTNNPSIHL